MSRKEVAACVLYQVGALQVFLAAEGVIMSHLKPHGALFGMAQKDEEVANGIAMPPWPCNMVDALTSLSQGWPQHINSVSVAAIRVTRDHGGSMNECLLQQAVESGRKYKDSYYATRLQHALKTCLSTRKSPQCIKPRVEFYHVLSCGI